MGSFVGGDTDGGNVTSLTVNWPVHQTGDIAILLWGLISTETATDPSGFDIVDVLNPANSGTHQIRLLSRISDGSEGTGAITMTCTGTGNRMTVALGVYRGYVGVDGFSRFDETVSQTTHDCPSYTLIAADCGIVVGAAERSSTNMDDWTPPTSFNNNEVDTLALGTGAGGTFTALATDDLNTSRAASTVVNPGNWISPFASANDVIYTIALEPESAASTTPIFLRPTQAARPRT